MSVLFDHFIHQTGTIEVGPSFLTLYTLCSDLTWSIITAKTDNFYHIQNLPSTQNYFDSFFTAKDYNLIGFENDLYIYNLYTEYLFSVEFDRSLYVSNIYWKRPSFRFMYMTDQINLFFVPNDNNLNVMFSHLILDKLNTNWFLNLELENNLKFLKNLRLFSNSNYLSSQYDCIVRNFDGNGLYFYFLYNRWDFEMAVHSIFSLWYETHGALFEDYLYLQFTPFFSETRDNTFTDMNFFSSQWAYSSELTDGYYMNRYGWGYSIYHPTPYHLFQVENNYITHDFLTKKQSIDSYLDHIMQFQLPKKKSKILDVADFTRHMSDLNMRNQTNY